MRRLMTHLLINLHTPLPMITVGAGDLRLMPPASLLVKYGMIIRVQRGPIDHKNLKKMTQALQEGANLCIFPEGGTWEKRLDDVKPGAAYLSSIAGARIVPVATWWYLSRLAKNRPIATSGISLSILVIHLPPIEAQDRKTRQQIFRDASVQLMKRIYNHLPLQDRERYDLHARQQFTGFLDITPQLIELPQRTLIIASWQKS